MHEQEIVRSLGISPRTVTQHIAYVVLRTGITEGRKRAKVATAGFCEGADGVMQPRDQLDRERDPGYNPGWGRANEQGDRQDGGLPGRSPRMTCGQRSINRV